MWSRVLLAVPRSRLLLLAGDTLPCGPAPLAQKFTRHGVSLDRIELAARRGRQEYLDLYNRIDIGLDPFPFNGDNTLCDAMLMGVPTITLAGDAFVSRRGLSHLKNLGLEDLVANSADDYIAIAVRTAAHLPELADLRLRTPRRLFDSPLYDAPGFVTALEAAYREMWERWCHSKGFG